MKWNLIHEDVSLTVDSGVLSKSYIILEKDGIMFEIGKINNKENHILGSKRVLVDTANMLKRIAHEMENKADKLY